MKKIYISYGANDRYLVSETKKDHMNGETFDSYQALLAYFKGDSKQVKGMKRRELLAITTGLSDEKITNLEMDLAEAGFKNIRGVIRE